MPEDCPDFIRRSLGFWSDVKQIYVAREELLKRGKTPEEADALLAPYVRQMEEAEAKKRGATPHL